MKMSSTPVIKRKHSLVGSEFQYRHNEPNRFKKRKLLDKRLKTALKEEEQSNKVTLIQHPVLSPYFQTLLPLRQYLAIALKSSTSIATSLISRRERILRFKSDGSALRDKIAGYLDNIVVGSIRPYEDIDGADLFVEKELAQLHTASQDDRIAQSQNELVECAISLLFLKSQKAKTWANSVLAAGYRVNDGNQRLKTDMHFRLFGLDVVCITPNPHVAEFKNEAWEAIADMVGQETMLKLLSMQGPTEGGMFFPVTNKVGQGANAGDLLSAKCYQQYLGTPISEIPLEKKVERFKSSEPNADLRTKVTFTRKPKVTESVVRKPNDIRLVRSRIFYAKPANNKHAEPKSGLPHIHVLNRYHDHSKRSNRVHVLKYVFPRAFGLHNVFTSNVDRKYTIQSFQDYTLREEEIDMQIRSRYDDKRLQKVLKIRPPPLDPGVPDADDPLHHGEDAPPMPLPDVNRKERDEYEMVESIPKRFRGKILELVGELIKRQRKCSYHPLLQFYCPSILMNSTAVDPRPRIPAPLSAPASPVSTFALKSQISRRRSGGSIKSARTSLQAGQLNLLASTASRKGPAEIDTSKDPILLYSTNPHQVFTFLRAILSNIIPMEFWGTENSAIHHRNKFFGHLEQFIKLRRYETLTLHEVMQGFKVSDLQWLHQQSPKSNGKIKLDIASTLRCNNNLSEFIYYIFDSLVIPLIRAHFYVTESTTEKNTTCYFRQDVWKKLTQLHLNRMISTMFSEISTNRARSVMKRRECKFSTVRLLPKASGVRFLSNLRRRCMEVDSKSGRQVLGKSINQILKPNHTALTFEKFRQPRALGASMFAVGEILSKLASYKERLVASGDFGQKRLYFVKVDVTGCYDSIPQGKLLEVIEQLYMERVYKVRKQARVLVGAGKALEARPRIMFPEIAESPESHQLPIDLNKKFVEGAGLTNKSVVFVDRVVSKYHDRDGLLRELREHVMNNFVQIGKRFYRQSVGIPQGSVMSTLLCNMFYADLEAKELPFTQIPSGVLMRLIDDFLFITTNRDHAQRFCDAMHQGFPEYGVVVKPEKSLVNFEADYRGRKIERVFGDAGFPYCGTLIDTKTLQTKRDWSRREGTNVGNMLTVEYSGKPVQKMLDKMLSGWKLVSTAIYLNTKFNSRETIATNLYHSFVDAGMKFHRYYRSISNAHGAVREKKVIEMVEEFMTTAYKLIMARERRRFTKQGRVVPKKGLIGRLQVKWLVAKAFLRVLGKKQTSFPGVLNWLEGCIKATQPRVDRKFMKAIEDTEVDAIFAGMRY